MRLGFKLGLLLSVLLLMISLLVSKSYVNSSPSSDVIGQTDTPSFPSCQNPQGEVKVNYDQGIFAIVGDPIFKTGSDTVYTLENNNYLQCFCAEDKSFGIQTNWLNASGLSPSQISEFKKDHWQYVENGADWDLNYLPYLAKNSPSSCQ